MIVHEIYCLECEMDVLQTFGTLWIRFILVTEGGKNRRVDVRWNYLQVQLITCGNALRITHKYM
jgi:hypothetical protein